LFGERASPFWLGYLLIAAAAACPWPFVIDGGLSGKFPVFVIFALTSLLLGLACRPIYLVAIRHPLPTRQIVAEIRANWRYLLTTTFVLVALSITLDGAMQIKGQIPQVVPFYADPYLADIDKALFFGVDPWRITHAIVGPWGTRVVDAIYGLWHLSQIVLCIYIALTPDRTMQVRAALTYQISWLVLGSGLATALSSVGPCFYDRFYGGDRFASLLDRLEQTGPLHSTLAKQYLLASEGTDAIGAGISAAPSLHVAVAVLVALVVRDKWPRYSAAGWAFAILIFFGSIHLGWHYATDGLISLAIVPLIWKASARITGGSFQFREGSTSCSASY
jgi:hypothetical protein